MRKLYNSFIALLEQKLKIDARYFIRGGFWLTVSQIVALLFGLITTALLAHYLSEADYGIYRYLLNLVVIFSALSLTGMNLSVLQTAAKKYYSFYEEVFKVNLYYNIAVFLSALSGAGYYLLKENTVLSLGCLLIALLQPLTNIFQFVPAFLQGTGKFKESATLHSIRATFISLTSLATLFLTTNILVLLGTYLFSSAITNAFSYWYYKPSRTTPTPPNVLSQYLTYAKHNSARNIISTVAFRADSILVFTQLGAVELAFYTIATVIPEQVKGTFKSLTALLLPKYAKFDTLAEIKSSIPKRCLQLFAILCTISFLYILIAPLLYKIVFPKYEEVIIYSQIFALSFPAMIMLVPINALQSQLEEKKLYALNIAGSIILILSSVIGVLLFGLMGAIVAKVAYRYIVMIMSFFTLSTTQTEKSQAL